MSMGPEGFGCTGRGGFALSFRGCRIVLTKMADHVIKEAPRMTAFYRHSALFVGLAVTIAAPLAAHHGTSNYATTAQTDHALRARHGIRLVQSACLRVVRCEGRQRAMSCIGRAK